MSILLFTIIILFICYMFYTKYHGLSHKTYKRITLQSVFLLISPIVILSHFWQVEPASKEYSDTISVSIYPILSYKSLFIGKRDIWNGIAYISKTTDPKGNKQLIESKLIYCDKNLKKYSFGECKDYLFSLSQEQVNQLILIR